jgi:hypothetical protein
MTTPNIDFINKTYDHVASLKQAPHSWYEDPMFAYIPIIGALISSFAQFSFHTQLNELGAALKDIDFTPTCLSISQKAVEKARKVQELLPFPRRTDFTAQDDNLAALQATVDGLQKDPPAIKARAQQLLEVSNHNAVVSIIQSVVLCALVISAIVLRILQPVIGMALFMVCGSILAGHA